MSSGDLTKGSPRLGGSFPSRTATKWLGCQSSARDSASSVRALRRRCVVLFWISLTVCFARRERSMTSPWLRPSSAMRSLIAVATAAQSPVTHSSALHVVAESSADIIPTGDFPAVWRFGMISSQITPRIRLPSAERPTTVTLRPSQANDVVRDCGRDVAAWPSGRCGLPHGGAVGDQAGYRRVSLIEVLTASDVALQRPPVLVLGVGVLHTDPLRGLLVTSSVPGRDRLRRGILLRLQRWRFDLVGELLGQSSISGVDLRLDLRVALEQVADALGLHSGLVVHAAGPKRPGPQRAALFIGDDGGLFGVLLHFPGHERAAAGFVRTGASDPDLGAVDPQLHTFGCGVREHVSQRAQPQFWLARHGEPTLGQQRPDLVYGAGDGGAVYPVEQGQRGVRELKPQDDQGGDDAVGEYQFVVGAGSGGSMAGVAPTLLQSGLVLGLPGQRQLGDQLAQPMSWNAGTDTMAQGRAGPS